MRWLVLCIVRGVYKQNSIMKKYPCMWLDSRKDDHCKQNTGGFVSSWILVAGRASGRSKGGRPQRVPPPTAQKILNFMQFFGKFGKIVCWRPPPPAERWRPLLRGILDPPLSYYIDWSIRGYFADNLGDLRRSEMKKIILCKMRFKPCEIKLNLRKHEKLGLYEFFFVFRWFN